MSDDTYTYRFVKNGRASETHSFDEQELLQRAAAHLETGVVLPVHIRLGRQVIFDIRDITDAWEARYLTDASFPIPPAPRRAVPPAAGRPRRRAIR